MRETIAISLGLFEENVKYIDTDMRKGKGKLRFVSVKKPLAFDVFISRVRLISSISPSLFVMTAILRINIEIKTNSVENYNLIIICASNVRSVIPLHSNTA